MFNGLNMMDPELIKIAQEQMNRMSPSDLARMQQQMMSNPDLMRMASESMKNMSPEDLKTAAEQLKYTRPEEMSEIGEKMANATPDELSALRSRAEAQINYELNAAQLLKKQGNELHSQGKFKDALEKYTLAKRNVKGIPSSKSRPLLLACSLNLMSCYLKTRQYDECVKEGSEVLNYDSKNVKALYRRGQAYKELGQLEGAISDLSKASEVSPDDETIADVLRDAKETLTKGGGQMSSRLVIEEITEESASSEINESSSTDKCVIQSQEASGCSMNQSEIDSRDLTTNPEYLRALKDDPVNIRSFQNFISNTDPDTLNALNAGRAGEISPEMFKTASSMISKMSPEELQRMFQMASSFQATDSNNLRPGSVPPNVTPDMLKTATEMMSKIPPEELQKMYKMASPLQEGGKEPSSSGAALPSTGLYTDAASRAPEMRETLAANGNHVPGQPSSSNGFSNVTPSRFTFPNSGVDFQQQLQSKMQDPAMRQVFTSMIKNMNPEMMANMSEQFGFKLSKEDAEKAQQAMSSLSPEALDKMMRWADRLQRGADRARRTKNWLLGKPGMVLAIFMLILAIVLHRLGFIGS